MIYQPLGMSNLISKGMTKVKQINEQTNINEQINKQKNNTQTLLKKTNPTHIIILIGE
jgi:hypothetical protein